MTSLSDPKVARLSAPRAGRLPLRRAQLSDEVEVNTGDRVRMRGSEWTVVGTFASGDAHDSEMCTDINVARTTFLRLGTSSVLAALDGPDGLQKLKAAVAAEPRLSVDVMREQDYFSCQTKQFRKTIGFLAGVVTIIMGLGAVFAALNSMYAAVAARGKEIATLRAIGFRGTPVVVSVMIEALLLALAGGVLGALLAYLLFNNLSVSTLGQNFTQVVFNFKVTPELVTRGLIIAVIAFVLFMATFYISSPTVPRVMAILVAVVGVAVIAGLVPIRGGSPRTRAEGFDRRPVGGQLPG